MHVVLASLGTDGDVLPYVGIGARLRRRGHRVTLLASENFRTVADELQFAFGALASNEEMDALLASPDFWHPVKTAKHSAQWGGRLLRRHYELIREAASADQSVLVANPGVLAARIVQEKLKRPLVSVALQPWLIKSIHAPPVMPGRLSIPRWAPRASYRLFYRLLNMVVGRLMGPALASLRRELGLPPFRGQILQWWWSEQRILGLFPDWFAPPQVDWLPQIRLTGFPLLEDERDRPLSPEVLEFCRAGGPPIVFSFGTGMMHAAHLFRAAVDACQQLGMRGIFLTRHEDQLPQELPGCIRHWRFVPLPSLLPHCSAIVHHGGVGTLASALAAGTPQLIVPFAFDQPDNADRVRKLGVGGLLRQKRADGPSMARAISQIAAPAVQERCRATSRLLQGVDGLANAADWIEDLANSQPSGNNSNATFPSSLASYEPQV